MALPQAIESAKLPPVVYFQPYPKQEEFIQVALSGKYKYIFYGGAAGGGKTYAGLSLLILLCKLYPGSKWVVVRKDAEKLRLTSIPSFHKVCPPAFLKKFNQNDNTAYFKNGSQILFVGQNLDRDPDLTKFDGIECNGFLLEEVQELDVKMHHKANLRAGRHILPKDKKGQEVAQPPKLVLHTGNPSHNWSKKMFYDPWELGTLEAPYAYVPATMEDNPSLSQDYVDSLGTLDPITFARYVKGDWHITDVDMPFAYSYDSKKHLGNTGEPVKDQPLVLSFDFNIEPITCLAIQHNRYRNKVRIHREFRLGPSDIYKLCERIRVQYDGYYLMVTGDASGMNSSAMVKDGTNYYEIIKSELGLEDRQFRVPTANPLIKNSRVLCNSLLARHPDYLIDKDNCPYLAEDLQFCEVNNKGEIDKLANAYRTHLLDCWRYYNNSFLGDFVRYKL